MKLNKKFLILPVIAALIGAFYALPANAATPSDTPERYITLNAEGTVSVTPDAVRLNATVTFVGATSKEALAGASTAAAKVRAAIRAKAIAAKDLKTTSITVYPEYSYTQEKGSFIIGYRASQTFLVTIRSADVAGVLVEDIVNAGGNDVQIQSVTPFVIDATKATLAARAEAVSQAKEKAASYASLLGIKLGKITYLIENSSPISFPVVMGIAKAADSAGTEVDLGSQDLTVSITIRWSLA